MIPVSTLYDEYIDRPKLTEQKNPFEYIVPPPSRGVRNNKFKVGLCSMLESVDRVLRAQPSKDTDQNIKYVMKSSINTIQS